MDLFLEYKIVITRTLGVLILVLGLGSNYYSMPSSGMTENDKAAARIARMEASTQSKSSKASASKQNDSSKFLEALKSTQEKQAKYMTIIIMVFGVAFLGYSFLPRKEDS